jgi:hypothetical protein
VNGDGETLRADWVRLRVEGCDHTDLWQLASEKLDLFLGHSVAWCLWHMEFSPVFKNLDGSVVWWRGEITVTLPDR